MNLRRPLTENAKNRSVFSVKTMRKEAGIVNRKMETSEIKLRRLDPTLHVRLIINRPFICDVRMLIDNDPNLRSIYLSTEICSVT